MKAVDELKELARCVPLPVGPEAPIRAVGTYGHFLLLRDRSGKVFAVDYDDLTRKNIAELFDNDLSLLHRTWPHRPSGRGWDHERAAASLIYCCSREGLKDPAKYGLVVVRARERDISFSYWCEGEDGSRVELPPGPLSQSWRQYPVARPLRRRR